MLDIHDRQPFVCSAHTRTHTRTHTHTHTHTHILVRGFNRGYARFECKKPITQNYQ